MIIIIDTEIGNFKSVQNMLSRINVLSCLSKNIVEIEKATKIILPGIGTFDQGMHALKKYNLVEILQNKAKDNKTKILGICLGMQLLGNSSEEGCSAGLGIIQGHVRRFNDNLKVPHMGWNYAIPTQESMLFSGLEKLPRFYFTHSYFFDCLSSAQILSKTLYGTEFVSSICLDDRIFGVQFHPEKSHRFGLQLLKNFAEC